MANRPRWPKGFVVLSIGAALLVGASSALAQIVPPMPDVVFVADPAVTCGGDPITPTFATEVIPLGPQDLSPEGLTNGVVTTELTFKIADDGRPRDVANLPPNAALNSTANRRNQADLSAWRFASEARSDCRLSIRYQPSRVDRASVQTLAAYFGGNRAIGPLRESVERRLGGPERACEHLPAIRSAGLPDFNAPDKRVGVEDWTVVRWSINEAGSAYAVEVLASSGSAGFDDAVLDAAANTERVGGEARRGCVYNWFRRGSVLPAPTMPRPPSDPNPRCPAEALAAWRPAPLAGPLEFQQRGIEGWALVRFDIAPWGEVGRVELIDAQPAAAFGEAAMSMVRRGRAARGEGAIGCVQPVEFRIVP